MESFGDMTRRIKAEQSDLESQRSTNSEVLYKRQQRLRRAIVFVCDHLISKNVPHLNIEIKPKKTRQVPVTNLFGKIKRYDTEIIQPQQTIRGWAIDEPHILSDERGPGKTYLYTVIAEDGEYYSRVHTDIVDRTNGGIVYSLPNPELASTKEELKLSGWGANAKELFYNEAEEKLVKFAIYNNIDLSEAE